MNSHGSISTTPHPRVDGVSPSMRIGNMIPNEGSVASLSLLWIPLFVNSHRIINEQTTYQNVDGWCQAMGKRRQIKKGEKARREHKLDQNSCGGYQVIGRGERINVQNSSNSCGHRFLVSFAPPPSATRLASEGKLPFHASLRRGAWSLTPLVTCQGVLNWILWDRDLPPSLGWRWCEISSSILLDSCWQPLRCRCTLNGPCNLWCWLTIAPSATPSLTCDHCKYLTSWNLLTVLLCTCHSKATLATF